MIHTRRVPHQVSTWRWLLLFMNRSMLVNNDVTFMNSFDMNSNVLILFSLIRQSSLRLLITVEIYDPCSLIHLRFSFHPSRMSSRTSRFNSRRSIDDSLAAEVLTTPYPQKHRRLPCPSWKKTRTNLQFSEDYTATIFEKCNWSANIQQSWIHSLAHTKKVEEWIQH